VIQASNKTSNYFTIDDEAIIELLARLATNLLKISHQYEDAMRVQNSLRKALKALYRNLINSLDRNRNERNILVRNAGGGCGAHFKQSLQRGEEQNSYRERARNALYSIFGAAEGDYDRPGRRDRRVGY